MYQGASGAGMDEISSFARENDSHLVMDTNPSATTPPASSAAASTRGRWLEPARRLVKTVTAARPDMPPWLFSGGPVGDPSHPVGDPAAASKLAARPGVRGHVTFAGRLDKGDLRLTERAVVRAVKAPEGDFRDWAQIRRWVSGIAAEIELTGVARPATMTPEQMGSRRWPPPEELRWAANGCRSADGLTARWGTCARATCEPTACRGPTRRPRAPPPAR
jgi:hypothetical protein